ncbi:right-handed parallel beta-helix repeat-containing protein [Lentzea indica]|uniref:right-handed parallel beta-helix repeat-containing protein n=1 Tax=Lentzea indica TaxID=2604800 RepID=UPI00143A1051|nr:right-handed parallel beta-helix repeat-containing protein [Lentzea indica]
MQRQPDVLLVGEGGFADVAAALRSARPGDVIELAPGEYDGEVVVDVPVELRPKNERGTVTLSSGTGNTLMLLADATVRDLTVVGCAWGAAAVEVSGPVAPRILDCEVRAPGHTGIRVRSGARPEVSSCRIGPALHGLRIESAAGEYRRCEFADTALESVIATAGAEPRVVDSRFVRQGGHAAVAVDRGTVLSLHSNDFEGGPVASVRASDGGRIVITDATFHDGGGPALEVDDDGVLHANRIRIAGIGSEGVLVSGGEGRFTACRFTGTHGPAVWMTGGRARFEDCEAIDADHAGFLVVDGAAEFVRCVAHNNAGQGFSLLSEVTLTECSSFGNGQPDDVGQRPVQPAALSRTGTAVRRVGRDGYRTIGAAIDDADAGDVIEIEAGEYEEGLVLDKPVELRAAGKPGSVRLTYDYDEVLSLCADVTVRGISLSGSTWVANDVAAVFERCEFSGDGVSAGNGSSVTLRECHVRTVVIVSGALTMVGCSVTEAGVKVMHEECVVDLRDCVFDGATYTAIDIARGRVVITDVTVKRAQNGLQLYNGTVVASGLTIADSIDLGIDMHGGTGSFTSCVITGAGSEGVLVFSGEATFEQCQAVGGGSAGFQVVLGTVWLTRCLAKDNRGKGFDLHEKARVTTTECDSTGNGILDGIHATAQNPGRLVRVGNVAELKQAVEKAIAGDVIEIAPGNYRRIDGLRIRRAVEVRAAEGPGTVQLAVSRPVVVSAAATLRGIRIRGNFIPGLIVRTAGGTALIERCEIITNDGATVEIADSASPTFRDCEIKAGKRGVVLRAAGGRYERCRFVGGPEPVVVVSSTGAVFLDCEIRQGRNDGTRVEVDGAQLDVGSDRLLSGSVHHGESATVRLVE